MALVCVCRGYFTSLFAFEEQGGRAADETDCRGRNRNYRHPLAATPSLYGCRPGDAALRALRMRQECVHCRQTGVVACAVHAHIFWLSDQKFRVSRPLAAARDSSSACLITLTARTCIPLSRPNLRVNWNRKLEQMLFWQNPSREPIFQFLTDFEKLPVFLFQCRTFAPDLNRNLYADHPFATGQDSVLEQETRRRLENVISLTGLGEWTNRYGQSA